MKNIDYTLYLVTDSQYLTAEQFEFVVKQAIEGGVTLVQLREKNVDTGVLYEKAMRIKRITDSYNIPLIIDDRVDVMLACDAAGVHVGQTDMPAHIVRRLIGKNKILGVSARNEVEAQQAEIDGADYLGVGAMFPTATKRDAQITSMKTLKTITENVHIPVVAIGGIQMETLNAFECLGVQGFAVVSALMKATLVKERAEAFRKQIQKIQKHTNKNGENRSF